MRNSTPNGILKDAIYTPVLKRLLDYLTVNKELLGKTKIGGKFETAVTKLSLANF